MILLNSSLLCWNVEDVVAADEGVAVFALQLAVHVLLGLELKKIDEFSTNVQIRSSIFTRIKIESLGNYINIMAGLVIITWQNRT